MKKMYLLLSAFLLSGLANAKSTAAASASSNVSSDDYSWCAHAYMGQSWTQLAGVANPSAAQFNAVASTDTDDAKLGKGSFVGLGVNRQLWSWVSVGTSSEFHTPYRYDMYHTGGAAATSAGAGTGEGLGTRFNRHFDLQHYSAMFNVNLHTPEDWSMSVGSLNVSLAVGGSVGVGVNEVRNFYSEGYAATALYQKTSVALPNSKASLAWAANGGLNFVSEDSNVYFGLAYRYYYGGKFASSATFNLNDAANTGTAVALTAWEGKLKAHQAMMTVGLEF